MADQNTITPSRRATLFGAAALASVAVSAGAKASPISPAVQKAFDEWQAARTHFLACDAINDESFERFHAMLPERNSWKRPLSAEHAATIQAALELSGHKATEDATMDAYGAADDAFLRFIGTPPQTMADVKLQAKHLSDWLNDAEVERPVFDWLAALTGEVAA